MWRQRGERCVVVERSLTEAGSFLYPLSADGNPWLVPQPSSLPACMTRCLEQVWCFFRGPGRRGEQASWPCWTLVLAAADRPSRSLHRVQTKIFSRGCFRLWGGVNMRRSFTSLDSLVGGDGLERAVRRVPHAILMQTHKHIYIHALSLDTESFSFSQSLSTPTRCVNS
jgi:hypothetical protein